MYFLFISRKIEDLSKNGDFSSVGNGTVSKFVTNCYETNNSGISSGVEVLKILHTGLLERLCFNKINTF